MQRHYWLHIRTRLQLDLRFLVLQTKTYLYRLDLWLWEFYLPRGRDGSLGLAHVSERSVFGLLVDVVYGLRMFLLVVDEGAAVRAGPAANKLRNVAKVAPAWSHLHLSHL